MRKEDFRQWLDGKIKKKPISDCISRCTTVEYALKVDLDEEYRKDNGQAVIAKLSYNARDAKANLPVPQEFNFKEDCNVIQRLTDLRSSVNRYFDFCKNDYSSPTTCRTKSYCGNIRQFACESNGIEVN